MVSKIGKKLNIKYFALSFTNSVNDVRYFDKLIPKAYKIFKIESKMAIKNLHEILVVCHEAEGLRMDEITLTWESIKDWSIQLQTEVIKDSFNL